MKSLAVKLSILAAILAVSGCAVASIKVTEVDGRVKEASTVSFFKDIAGGNVDLQNETFNVNGSKVDLETLLRLLQVAQ